MGCQFGVPGGTYPPKKYPSTPPGVVGTPLFGLNRYVPLNRVWFAGHWLFTGIQFHCLVSVGCVFGLDASKRDVTRDNSQRQFLAQHSVPMLEQCCNHSKQCHNNVAMLRYTKNGRYELSRVTSPWKSVKVGNEWSTYVWYQLFFNKNLIIPC